MDRYRAFPPCFFVTSPRTSQLSWPIDYIDSATVCYGVYNIIFGRWPHVSPYEKGSAMYRRNATINFFAGAYLHAGRLHVMMMNC